MIISLFVVVVVVVVVLAYLLVLCLLVCLYKLLVVGCLVRNLGDENFLLLLC